MILEDNETSTVSLGATAVSTRVDDIESTVELNKQIGPLSNVENGCYVLEECSLPPLEVNHLIPILAEGNHHSPRLSQDATKQHSYGISEENWADTVPQPSNENGDHEHGEYVSEFEKDMLLAFKEQESLSLANIPNSLHPQNLSSEPAHPQIDQELDQSPTNVARLEEPRHGCSQVELPVQQRPEAAVDVMREADDGESLRGEQVKRRQDSLEEPQSEVHSTGSGCSRNTNDTGGEDKDDEDEEPRPAKRQKRVSVHPILTPQTPIFHSDNALEAPLGQLHSATIALATQLETEDTPPGADGRNLPTSPETEHYISRTSRSPTSSTALEITNLEESQGGIPAMDPNQEWEIRNIVGRKTAGGKVQYLVEWETTWMRESDLGQARELIDEFETDLKRGQQGVMSRSNALDEGEPKKRRGRPPNR